MKKNLLSIGEVSKIMGVHIKSLRYYDRIGVLKPAHIDPDTAYRYYSVPQLGIVAALQTCVELDIPLKEISRYSGEDGRTIHYARLLEQGRELAKVKIRAIRDGLKTISAFQKEIDRNEKLSRMKQPAPYDFPTKRYLAEPLTDETDESRIAVAFVSLYARAAEEGCKAGYEWGRLSIFRGGAVERYRFIDLLPPVKSGASGVFECPAGRCMVRHVSESRIDAAPEEFPEQFAKQRDLVVFESELFTADYDVERPRYELRCSPRVPVLKSGG